jgi:mono/diheme cytochrome c family protein
MMKKALPGIFLLFIGLTACSLASDLTPPPGYHPTAIIQPTAAPVVYPLVPPDPAQGAAIFAEKCQPCHGDTGMGDGPKASQLPNPVSPIGSAQLSRQSKPTNWYDVVTNGRVDKFMPPFASLTDRQRWNVIAYVYTLSVPAAAMEQGKAVYTDQCASCHGPAGRGDGPKAASAGAKMPDWTDESRLAQRSANDLYGATTNGVAPGMPAYAASLSDDQRWAVVGYVRSLSFAGNANNTISASGSTPAAIVGPTAEAYVPGATAAATSAPALATPAAASTPAAAESTPPSSTTATTVKINISGKVTYSTGGALPAGLKVNLLGYDNMTQSTSANADVNADGSFSFPDVDVVSGRVWLAQVMFNNVTFSSQPLHDTDIQPGQDASLAIAISDSSSDASVLSAQRLHVFLDFSVPGTLQVAELFIVQNKTDKAVVSADPQKPALQFTLPEGAMNLQFQDGSLGDGRYVQTSGGFGDSQAVPPQGTAQVLFAFDLPYPNASASLSVPLPMAVDSAVVMAPAGGVNVSGPQITSNGTRSVQSTTNQGSSSTIAMFSAANLAKGASLDLNISGQPPADASSTGAAATGSSSPVALVIGIAVFGLALVAGGYWLIRQRRAAAAEDEDAEAELEGPAESAESILDAIVALDDLYQAGELPEDAYRERRAELKSKLKELRG